MSEPALIVLLDVDGTLLDSGGTGRLAMEAAFSNLYGDALGLTRFGFGGLTDREIARIGIETHTGAPAAARAIDELLESYLSILTREVKRALSYRTHDGVMELISALEREPMVATGLGTGNLRRGAEIKLGRAGLWERFPFGGFGCDSEQRSELLAIGAERGASRLSRSVTDCEVVVVGDTPRDIAAARNIHARVVAVATGPSSVEDLSSFAPDALLDSLADSGALEAILGRTPQAG